MYIYIYIHTYRDACIHLLQAEDTSAGLMANIHFKRVYIYICYVCSGKNIGTLPTITIITMSFSWCSMGARPFYYSTNQRENIPVYIYIYILLVGGFKSCPPKK